MEKSKYLFVAYSDADYEQIDNIFLELYKNGVVIKDAKDEAETETDTMISESSAILFVISPNSISSNKIQYYLNLADQYNKHIIPYYLCAPEEVSLSRSLLMKMDGSATIPAYEYHNEVSLMNRVFEEIKPYFEESFETKKRKKNPVATIAGIAALICAVIAVYLVWIVPSKQEKALQNVKNATVKIYAIDADLDAYENGEDEFINYAGTGSGFFIDLEGTIATNYHVIENGIYYVITPSNEADGLYLAELISYDEELDLALLRIDDDYKVTNFLALASGKVDTGDTVYVSGYPRGIDLTLSNGIVSNEEHHADYDAGYYFLVTAAVSPGNSGGPVVNKSGKVIGIATAKYADAENMNLVRPVEYLKELIKRSK